MIIYDLLVSVVIGLGGKTLGQGTGPCLDAVSVMHCHGDDHDLLTYCSAIHDVYQMVHECEI